MLVGLITKLIPLEKVETAADFLVDAMSIMFVPATVGIMASVDALKEMLLPICVITVVSTVLIMIVTGRVSQHIIRGRKTKVPQPCRRLEPKLPHKKNFFDPQTDVGDQCNSNAEKYGLTQYFIHLSVLLIICGSFGSDRLHGCGTFVFLPPDNMLGYPTCHNHDQYRGYHRDHADGKQHLF